ncbi:hypothetical protein B0J13DRAFT_11884 [Dactylonectria estremocensis]|uniref:Uncharacterized protein n=1 Tax=Dactylonectria estremocensis TaxID=1079267 RepID=A0A9P9FIV1_9HYPO|nr:hypothetical protein B0J13DRAFT_11884 [Dactylonectria estremocensis]
MLRNSVTQAMRPLASLRTSVLSRSTRQFSSTPAYGFKAIFSETDNSELNEVLKSIQEKIVFPAYLPEAQRELVFNPKHRTRLQQNPIVIELDGLEHKFSTLDRFTEIPNSKKAFNTALKLMKTREDWDNLGTLLAGYKKANIKLHPFHYNQIIRRAGKSGQIYAVIECAKQATETGFMLNESVHITAILNVFSEMITESSAENARIMDAAKWTNLVLDLLERHPHADRRRNMLERAQFHPFVRGQVLFVQASAAQYLKQREQPAEEELKAVSDSAQALVSLWSHGLKEGGGLQIPASISELKSHRGHHSRTRAELSMTEFARTVALNIKGMRMARELVGDAAKGLEPIEKLLDEDLEEFVLQLPQYNQRCARVYAEVLGAQPTWFDPALVKPAAQPAAESGAEVPS